MKKIQLVVVLFIFISLSSFAQQSSENKTNVSENKEEVMINCAKCPKTETPLFIVFFKDKKYKMSGGTFREIKPEWIDSVNIKKNEQSTNSYGELGKYGTVEIFVKNDASVNLSNEFLEEFH